MRTQVFAHKGIIGIKSSLEAEGLQNDPTEPGQRGFIVDAAYVDISPEAFELLKKVRKSSACIGDVDVFKVGEITIFNWLGGPMVMISSYTGEGSRDFDPSLMADRVTEGIEVDPEFIKAIDAK